MLVNNYAKAGIIKLLLLFFIPNNTLTQCTICYKFIIIVSILNYFNIWIIKFNKFHKWDGISLYIYIKLNIFIKHDPIFYNGKCVYSYDTKNLRIHTTHWYTVWCLTYYFDIISNKIKKHFIIISYLKN